MERFQKSMLIYARYLLHIFHRSQCGYYSRVVYDDNERVLNLTKDIKESIGPYKDGIERYAFANAHEKLMAYILSNDEILLNRNLWEELIKYLKKNFDEIYDSFLLNSEEGYMSKYIDDHFFDPKQLVKDYQNRDYKKVIR